jgi:hypothetical protein
MPLEHLDLRRRAQLTELMDALCSRKEPAGCLRDMARLNRWFMGYLGCSNGHRGDENPRPSRSQSVIADTILAVENQRVEWVQESLFDVQGRGSIGYALRPPRNNLAGASSR